MKNSILKFFLTLMLGFATLSVLPSSAEAKFQEPQRMEQTAGDPVREQPVTEDFSDTDFESADQPELGALTGGDAVIVGTTTVVVVVLVVLILILI